MTRGLPSRVWSWSRLTHVLRGLWCTERHWREWKVMGASANGVELFCRACGRQWTLRR
jgi:hypothetical protein